MQSSKHPKKSRKKFTLSVALLKRTLLVTENNIKDYGKEIQNLESMKKYGFDIALKQALKYFF